MAGVLLHLAMGDQQIIDPKNLACSLSFKRAYVIGIILPDIAKMDLIRSEADFSRYFEGVSEQDRMSYKEYLEYKDNNHFDPDPRNPAQQDTKNPDLKKFVMAEYVDLAKPVWQGVLCHLMGDKAFYYRGYCVDEPRAMEEYEKEKGCGEVFDREQWLNSETGKNYYNDYDMLNRCVEDEFSVLEKVKQILPEALLEEILDAFSVSFAREKGKPEYMNFRNIRKYINCSKELNRQIRQGNAKQAAAFFDQGGLEKVFQD